MKPWVDEGDVQLFLGDALDVLATLPTGSVQTCVTSPPYWGLRDYGELAQIGSEETLEAYFAAIRSVMGEVWRVLRDDGTLWLNLGDTYQGPKGKELAGIPWRVAFALQNDGWYLRSDIIWSKPNPMPESVTDRPTKAHEYLFLLSKQAGYFYDQFAIQEECEARPQQRLTATSEQPLGAAREAAGVQQGNPQGGTSTHRNARSVWEIAAQQTADAHFATFPERLPELCIRAGTSQAGGCSICGKPWNRRVERTAMVIDRSPRTHALGQTRSSGTMLKPATSRTLGWSSDCSCDAPARKQTVLDPFIGSGTTALVARKLGRRTVGVDLSEEYLRVAYMRINGSKLRRSVGAERVARTDSRNWDALA